jgi:sulfoxide reductase catalytic subunit YedY
MGCALWRGVRLKDVLAAAGIRPNSAYIKLHGLERPVFPETPAFVRKLDYEEFNRDNVIIAYEMNGEELPLLNGYPLVLVVPGYFADNWVKMIERIDVLDHEEEIFYTDKAYRIPANSSESVPPGYPMPAETKPLKALKIKSVIGGPAENAIFHPGDKVKMSGVAFDDGHGVKAVFVSVDAGVNWVSAELDRDLGNYAFRRWNYSFTPTKKGAYTLMSRAVSNSGAIQPLPQDIGWNPAGYQWNAVDRLDIKVV